MKKILFSLLIGVATFATAQKKPMSVATPGTTTNPTTLFMVNGNLASQDFLERMKKNTKFIRPILSANQVPQSLKSVTGLRFPMIIAEAKENYYDRIALSTLNEQYGLAKNNPVYFDGNKISDTSLNVIGDVLVEMKVGKTDGQEVLNIWTTKHTMHAIAN